MPLGLDRALVHVAEEKNAPGRGSHGQVASTSEAAG
jgi:hypothetical protein